MTPGRSEDDRLAAIRERLREFVRDRQRSQFYHPKNLAMALASEARELLAHFRWVLTGDADAVAQDPDKRQQIEQEIADVAIAVLLFCDRTGVDLFDAIDRKISLSERHYPVLESTGRSERPSALASADPVHPRIMAVDWSGEAGGGRKTIWIAEVIDGRLARLENGRSRSELIDFLVESAAAEPNLIVGVDFAFAFPGWFAEQQGLREIRQLWALAEREGEQWLRTCNPRFWGKPGQTKPKLPAHYRATELAVCRKHGGQAKSVFQIGGAGAVGTGSIRGMPHLGRLSSEGFSVWPFDPSSLPLVVEIYRGDGGGAGHRRVVALAQSHASAGGGRLCPSPGRAFARQHRSRHRAADGRAQTVAGDDRR